MVRSRTSPNAPRQPRRAPGAGRRRHAAAAERAPWSLPPHPPFFSAPPHRVTCTPPRASASSHSQPFHLLHLRGPTDIALQTRCAPRDTVAGATTPCGARYYTRRVPSRCSSPTGGEPLQRTAAEAAHRRRAAPFPLDSAGLVKMRPCSRTKLHRCATPVSRGPSRVAARATRRAPRLGPERAAGRRARSRGPEAQRAACGLSRLPPPCIVSAQLASPTRWPFEYTARSA